MRRLMLKVTLAAIEQATRKTAEEIQQIRARKTHLSSDHRRYVRLMDKEYSLLQAEYKLRLLLSSPPPNHQKKNHPKN